ncbi:hypothetical protein [Burkholderia sp. Ac-20365]|uniref:hypothetical protein n=1 Tax=Burkholderia sp. Ac-20365 TaxID=2703897 RepID=UPI00197C7F09|nr:hypothetical protein [Burkholderia sp. Ac-20365]MBN3761220.1 hypothetical protein [Burkholderia sp. Ac-20365]
MNIGFLARCAVAVVALTSIRYSVLQEHVDVRVRSACAAGVSSSVVAGGDSCIYRDVSLRGNVLRRDFEVSGPTGIGISTDEALIQSPGNNAGFTWRSLALLLVAVAMWMPSLLQLFFSRNDPAAHQ